MLRPVREILADTTLINWSGKFYVDHVEQFRGGPDEYNNLSFIEIDGVIIIGRVVAKFFEA